MVRLAIVGIAGYGAVLIKLLKESGEQLGCRLVAAADNRLAELADQAAELEKLGVELFDDAHEMFHRCRRSCQAVYIASGIPSHTSLTVSAAEAGYHVHLEKPPAATIQEMDLIIEALDRADRMCLIGFHVVHNPGMAFLQRRIAEGAMGHVKHLVCRAGWPRNRAYYRRNSWAGKLRAGDTWVLDGPATNALAHQITHMLLLAAPEVGRYARPAAVRAELYAAGDIDSHDTAAIRIDTLEGPRIYWLGSHCTQERFGPIIEIEAQKARAVWDVTKEATITYADGSQESCRDENGRDQMVRNFIEAVAGGDGANLRCTPADARQFVLAVNGAHESSRRIHRIDAAFVRHAEKDTDNAGATVEALDDCLNAATRGPCLFSQVTGAPPWAVATEPFDLAGYSQFPQRFTCD